ncbi:MAG: four helix bundle protein [Verrucomicrobiota bacterium]|nr:four helix bundle protein [Verrucomicrobiota bacterium]
MARSVIREKSFLFALEVIKPFKVLQAGHEYVLSKQLLRSGTSIGANVEEALAAQSRRDSLSKMAVASKEAHESRYWLLLLQKSGLTKVGLNLALENNDELIRIRTSIVKTTAESPATQNSKFKTQN